MGVKCADEFAGVALPEGENRGHADASEIFLAVGAKILQENIAERDFSNAFFEMDAKSFFHASFVNRIDALRRDADFVKRQADGLGLPLEKFAADAVHADTFEAFGDRG